ncbi:MAG: flagellar hook-length control protein FliK [Bdellovibrionales bacterium]|nr:flagellar hook-length control protein FliK [Bdellovibrionales bacterium]
MNLQAMSASPFKELMGSPSGKRDVGKKDSAGNENNFEQVLSQKVNSRSAKKPQQLTLESKDSNDQSQEVNHEEESSPRLTKAELKGDSKKANQDSEKDKKDTTIKKFMDSFESEFNVPPARLVEAMSQLSPTQLKESAEKTADSVIGELNLDPQEESKAKQQYLGMIQELNKISDSTQSLAMVPAMGGASIAAAQLRFQKSKSQREALQKSIDIMNQSFWKPAKIQTELSDKLSAADLPQDLTSLSDVDLSQNRDLLNQDQQPVGSDMSDFNRYLDRSDNIGGDIGQDPNVAIPQSEGFQGNHQVKGLSDENIYKLKELGLSELPAELGDQQSLKPHLENYSKPHVMNSSDTAVNMTVSANEGKQFDQSKNYFSSGNSSFLKEMSRDTKEGKSKGEDLKTLFAAQLSDSNQPQGLKKSEALNGQQPVQELSQKQIDKNIQNVMNQAQYLVKKGGGEVKVKMSPEGLGDIHLKIELIGGRVQMQMLTDNKETKKILESSMSDLKDHLSTHKLAIDSIKIDSVQGVGTDVATRNQQSLDLSQQQQQQQQQHSERQTQQFWNQFHNQFGGSPQREALYESPKVKGYAQKKSNTIGPAEAEAKSASLLGPKKGKGLNLVA